MPLSARAILVGLAIATASLGAGCSGGDGGLGANAPRWEGVMFETFPDDIDPGALGLPTDKRPSTDPRFRKRAVDAEVIARVRVQTVSVEKRSNGEPAFRLGLQMATPRLVERAPMDEVIEVVIPPGGAAHGLARAWDVRLQGKTFVGFFRRFAGVDGETVIHFHLAPDSKDVGEAVQQVVALEEVKGS